MTPETLAEYLRVMRRAGLMSAELVVEGMTLRAVFGPDMPRMEEAVPDKASATDPAFDEELAEDFWPDWRGEKD